LSDYGFSDIISGALFNGAPQTPMIQPKILKQHGAKRVYIYEEQSDLGHYTADFYTVRCVDDRFFKTFKNFLKSRDVNKLDPKSPAGGAKVFSSPAIESDRDYNLRELEISIKLHHVKKVMLFTHHDCGAYGGFSKFDNDPDKEFEFHCSEHEKASKVIKDRFPDLEVETYFIDERGVVRTNE
jgi:hypothetical protein